RVTPSPRLLQSLQRSRFLVRRAKATLGVGERRSAAKGSGMEFLDYREYQPGDDVRHLDAHLFARTGSHYVRQYAVYQQLPITIIVDGSASMNFSTPTKFDFSRGLASALAFVGLAGGDAVQAAVHSHGRLHWSPVVRGLRRAPLIFDWMNAQQPAGTGFGPALASALPRLAHRGLVILISDWWLDDPEAGLRILGALQQEIVVLHVAAPEELEPARLGAGETRLIDAESGHEVELLVDQAVLDDYLDALAQWQDRLRRQVVRKLGRYVVVRSDTNIEHLLLRDWRRSGLIS
ncbi:MAG TPA: DUF58 domain-containing protein, partial [Xanthobacteraceae bacterium]|nr:DUF58 domain-containing protein [Xanthobacteraceae bacterium]